MAGGTTDDGTGVVTGFDFARNQSSGPGDGSLAVAGKRGSDALVGSGPRGDSGARDGSAAMVSWSGG
jgi:hypothetical protein